MGINFPIHPYYRKSQVQPEQAENALSRDLLARMRKRNSEPEAFTPEIAFDRLVAPDVIDAGMEQAGRIPAKEIPFAVSRSVTPVPRPAAPINEIPLSPTEREIINRQISIPDRPVAQQVERGGVLGTLKHIGKGALTGLAMGGREGAGQAIGGALAGAVAGGVSPQSVENLRFEQFVLPRHERDKALAQRDIAFQQEIVNDIARRTGIDPRTGQPTLQARQFDRQARATEAQLANIEFDNLMAQLKFQEEQKRQQEEARYKRDKDVADQRRSLTNDGGQFVSSPSQLLFGSRGRDAAGKPLPMTENAGNIIPSLDNRGFYRMATPQQEQERKLALEREKGKAELELDIEKRKQMSPLELEEFEKKEQIKNQHKAPDLTGVPTVTQFETAKAEAKELATRATNARTAGNEDEANKLQAQAEAAYNKAAAFHAQMIESGGYEDNSSGGWVGIKKKAQARGGSAGSSTSRSPRSTGTAKDISQEVFDHTVKTRFGGDVAAAKADAKRRGYTIGGKAIE